VAFYLVDTNVLLRVVHKSAVEHLTCLTAVRKLNSRGDLVFIAAQNIVELWSVATRPPSVNGLGMHPPRVDREIERLLLTFSLLDDDPMVFGKWRELVRTHVVLGRQVHDARLVASMLTYGVTHILTFNGGDFARYPGITTVDPATV
jgi:predicted nucleic acid-binding protein